MSVMDLLLMDLLGSALGALSNDSKIWDAPPKINRFADQQEDCYTSDRSIYHLRRRKLVQRQERTMQKYKVSIEYCVS